MDSSLLLRTWPARIAVIAAALLLAYWAGINTVASFMRIANPAWTVSNVGQDAGALEALAERQLAEGMRTGATAEAQRNAQRAIRRDALSVTAFRVLALAAELDRKPRRADSLLGHADRLSRRDLATRLVLIERAVARNDIEGALTHYDIALRTSGRSFEILAPILASAVSDRPIAAALARKFAANPPWLGQFLEYAIPNTPVPTDLARLMIRTRAQPAVRNRSAVVAMIDRLTRDSRFRQARLFLAGMVPGRGTDRLLTDGAFAEPAGPYPPFDWTFNASASAGAEPRPGEGLLYFAGPEQDLAAASQLLALPPGRYRLSTTATSNAAEEGSGPTWILRCASAHGQLAALDLPRGQQPRTVSALLTVPAGCEGQWLELKLRTRMGAAQIEGRVTRIAVERAR